MVSVPCVTTMCFGKGRGSGEKLEVIAGNMSVSFDCIANTTPGIVFRERHGET